MSYVFLVLAGMWMVDGLVLLSMPHRIINLLKTSLADFPSLILQWSGLAAVLGLVLFIGSGDLAYHPLWIIAGAGMVMKGLFLAWAPDTLRHTVLTWCFNREPIDYRFWGLGLCTLSLLLFDALGWFKEQ